MQATVVSIPHSFLSQEEAHDIWNMITAGRLIAVAALHRTHSVGAHFRSDHTGERPVEWEQHIQLEAVAGEGGIEPGRRILKT